MLTKNTYIILHALHLSYTDVQMNCEFSKNQKYVEHRIAKTMQTNGFIEAVTEWVYLDE